MSNTQESETSPVEAKNWQIGLVYATLLVVVVSVVFTGYTALGWVLGWRSDTEAVESVIQQDVALKNGLGDGELKDWVSTYVGQMKSVELGDCPADFRKAYQSHIRAWEDLEQYLSRVQDNGVLFSAWVLMTEDLIGDAQEFNQRIEKTWQAVEDSALTHGAQVPKTKVLPFPL